MTTDAPRHVEGARPIAQIASLLDINQLAGSFEALSPPTDVAGVDIHIDASNLRSEDDTLSISVTFQLAVHAAGNDPEDEDISPCFKVGAQFLLSYEVPDLHEYSNEAVEAFGMANAVFNAWPYWREFVQSGATRAGYPPMVVPVLRISDGRLVMGDDQ